LNWIIDKRASDKVFIERSIDGLHFEKFDKPLINESLSKSEFGEQIRSTVEIENLENPQFFRLQWLFLEN
jgi:hypothetical protein